MTDKQPLVSILIPVYNASQYIEETLQSVFNQTYSPIEIIVVNDGSTDSTLSILEKYKDRICLINQENRGQCNASNTAINNAKGDYIKFWDADDLLNPEHIELQINRLNGRTDAMASCEWARFYNNDYNSATFIKEAVWKDMDSMDWIKTSLSQKSDMMGAWLWLIPKNILKVAGNWDERLSLNNDFEFSIRLLLNTKEILFAKGAKAYYRSGISESLTNVKSEAAYRAALLSTDLGSSYLLKEDSSPIMKMLCANRYQEWVYRIYPNYLKIIREAELKIDQLGGSNKPMEGGKIFKILSSIFGWKIAKRIQLFFYKLGYLKILKNG